MSGGLVSGGLAGGPDLARLRAAGEQVARELVLDCTLAEIVRALERRGIDSLLLKGPALARWLYDDLVERSYSDIDLLVSPDQHSAAEACLAAVGFTRQPAGAHVHERSSHHSNWVGPGSYPAVIELHHTLFFLTAPSDRVWAALSRDAQELSVAGISIRVPSPAARSMIVALHAAQHGRGAAKVMEDLNRALTRTDTPTWEQAAALAGELSSLPAFAAGLGLSEAGRRLCTVLGVSAGSAGRVVRLFAGTPPDTAYGIERLITTPGIRGRVAYALRELVPSRGFMVASSRLARRGRLGLAAAYLARPLWLLGKLPAGTASWLRAARGP